MDPFCTRFHPDVNRCYCPSEEVAKRASFDGLEESQIRVFGLPIRPSFCQAVLTKVSVKHVRLLHLLLFFTFSGSCFIVFSYGFFFPELVESIA